MLVVFSKNRLDFDNASEDEATTLRPHTEAVDYPARYILDTGRDGENAISTVDALQVLR